MRMFILVPCSWLNCLRMETVSKWNCLEIISKDCTADFELKEAWLGAFAPSHVRLKTALCKVKLCALNGQIPATCSCLCVKHWLEQLFRFAVRAQIWAQFCWAEWATFWQSWNNAVWKGTSGEDPIQLAAHPAKSGFWALGRTNTELVMIGSPWTYSASASSWPPRGEAFLLCTPGSPLVMASVWCSSSPGHSAVASLSNTRILCVSPALLGTSDGSSLQSFSPCVFICSAVRHCTASVYYTFHQMSGWKRRKETNDEALAHAVPGSIPVVSVPLSSQLWWEMPAAHQWSTRLYTHGHLFHLPRSYYAAREQRVWWWICLSCALP